MKRKLPMLTLVMAGIFLLLPWPAQAQDEPTYTLSLGGGNELSLRIKSVGKELGIQAIQKPGSTGKVAIDLRVTLDADGRALTAQNKGAGFSGAPINLAALVEDSSQLSVTSPAQSGSSPVAAPVVTFVDFLAVLGRRYDWKKGGPQTFAYLDPTIRRRFASMIVQSEGDPQPLRIGTQDATVIARRLKVTVDVPELSESRRTTSLYVGPHGEALKGEMPVTRHPITASPAGTVSLVEGQQEVVTLYPDGIEPQGNTRFTRVRRADSEKGYKITYEGPPHFIRGTVETDDAFRPVRMEHEETWRRITATILPDRVLWAAPEQRIVTALQGEAWFLTHYVITGIWEKRAPFMGLTAGETAKVTYPTIEWGDRNGGIYTVSRLPDAEITDTGNTKVMLRHWQVSGAPYFAADLWTDGHRLVKLASSSGATIVRDGWAKATEKLVAP
ncbi:MAG: hypothetical protein V4671_25960, partial [Armatimonadota bacterium]